MLVRVIAIAIGLIVAFSLAKMSGLFDIGAVASGAASAIYSAKGGMALFLGAGLALMFWGGVALFAGRDEWKGLAMYSSWLSLAVFLVGGLITVQHL